MLVLTICKPRTNNECRYDEWNSAEPQEINLSYRLLFGLYEKILYQIITVIFELQVGIFSMII